jgi:hypothetical protein
MQAPQVQPTATLTLTATLPRRVLECIARLCTKLNRILLMKLVENRESVVVVEDVTSADSQNVIWKLITSSPNRAPSHGPDLLYAQRENSLIMEERGCRKVVFL